MALDEEFPEDSVVGKMLRQQRAVEKKKQDVGKAKAKVGLSNVRNEPGGFEPAQSTLSRRMREAGVE